MLGAADMPIGCALTFSSAHIFLLLPHIFFFAVCSRQRRRFGGATQIKRK